MHERHKLRIVLCVEQVVFEHGKLAGVWQRVVFAVFFLKEGVDLSGGEFVRIAALHLRNDRITGFHTLTVRLADQVAADDALCHGHRALAGVKGCEVQFTCLEGLGEGEQAAVLHNQLRDRIVATGELRKRNRLAVLQALEHGVVTHQLAEVDVVALVDGRKRGGDDDADAGPAFALRRRLSARTGAFALAGDDDFEISVFQCVLSEHPQAVVHETGVGIFGDLGRVVIKANPSRRHDVGVDVVEQVVNRQIFHAKIEPVVELLLDEVQIFGEEQHALPRCQGDVFRWSVGAHDSPSNLFTRHPFIIGSGTHGGVEDPSSIHGCFTEQAQHDHTGHDQPDAEEPRGVNFLVVHHERHQGDGCYANP